MREAALWKLCAKPCVYAMHENIEDRDFNKCIPIKIGYTEDIFNRLSQAQVSNPRGLCVLRIIECANLTEAKKLEHHLHETFKNFHIQGEWFDLVVGAVCNVFNYFSSNNFTYQNMLATLDGRILFFDEELINYTKYQIEGSDNN